MRRMVLCQRVVVVLVVAAAGVTGTVVPAQGDDVSAQATLPVTSTVDGDPGSLRDVIENDATNAGGDVVVLQAGATYTLTCVAGGDIVHGNTPLTIQGNGATITMAAGCNERLLSNGTGALVIDNVILGPVTTTFGASVSGALVEAAGSLAITNTVVSGNSITTSSGAILGIFNAASYSATSLEMTHNTISSADSFFAIFDGAATLTNCSISDFTVTTAGTGSIFGVVADGNVTMTDCHVTNITANSAQSVFGTVADGNLDLTTSSVEDTIVTATSGSIFGGIADGDVVMSSSQVIDVTGTTGGSVFGGVADGDLTMTSSLVNVINVTSTGDAVFGGVADGDLTATDSLIAHISAKAADAVFGGVVDGDATLTGSSITNVDAGSEGDNVFGGVVDGDLTMTRSSIAFVSILASGVIFGDVVDGDATVVNSTVLSTTGLSTGSSTSGTFDGDVSLVYATIAANASASAITVLGDLTSFGSVLVNKAAGNANCGPSTTTTSAGYNRADDLTCSLNAPTDVAALGFNPMFVGGTDNGYFAPTLLPSSSSPLVDAIPIAQCQADGAAGITTDERGLPRPALGGCDIGAVEVQPAPPAPPPVVVFPSFAG